MSFSSLHEVLHHDPARPCGESPGSADLFPDLMRLDRNVENRDRVASIYVESIGIGDQTHRLTTDGEAWSACLKHPNFRACYDLSMVRLAMQQALLKQ